MQFAVAEAAHIARFALPDQGCFLRPGAAQMTVQTVVREVGLSPLKPASKGGIAPIENRLKRLEPMQLLACRLTPEGIGIGLRTGRQIAIGLQGADPSRCGERCRWIKHPRLIQHRFDPGLGHGPATTQWSHSSEEKRRAEGL